MTNSLSALSLDVCVFLIRMGFVTTIILSLTSLVVTFLRKKSAAIRHGLWFAAVVGCCVAPVFVALLPVPAFLVVQPEDDTLSSKRNQAAEQTNLPAPVKEVDAKVFSDHTLADEFSSADGLSRRQFDFDSHAEQPSMNDAGSTEIDKSALPAVSPIAIATASRPDWHQLTARMSAWLTGLWMAVAVGLLLRIAFAVEATRRLCQQSEPCDDPMAIELLVNLRQQSCIKRPIGLKLSEEIQVPMIAGLARPTLLLPVESSLWSPERLQAVVRHELGHVARADLASQFVADLAIAVWWFQPMLWHAARRMRIEREFACDDLVLESGTSPCDYADELLAIASQAGSDHIASSIVVAMAGRTTVEQRIRAILDPALNRIPWSRRGAAALTIMLLIALSAIAPLTPTISARQPAKASLDEKLDVAIAAEVRSSTEGATAAPLASDEQTEATPLLESPLPIVQFGNGRSIEFVGITNSTMPAEDGWQPNGLPIKDPGYFPSTIVLHSGNTSSSFVENGSHPEPDADTIDFLFRFRGLKSQPSLNFVLPSQSQSYSQLPVRDPYNLRVAARKRGNPPVNSNWIPADGVAYVGFTDQPWGRYVKISPQGTVIDPIKPDETYSKNYASINVVGAKTIEGRPMDGIELHVIEPTEFSQQYAFEFRALDNEGNSHRADLWQSRSANDRKTDIRLYGLMQPLPEGKSLSHYEYRLRPYSNWVKFENVSLEPGTDTNFRAYVLHASPGNSELASATETSQSDVREGDKPLAATTKVSDTNVTSKGGEEKPNRPVDEELVQIAGKVVDAEGRGVSGADVVLENYQDKILRTTSDENGRFVLPVKGDIWKWQYLTAQVDQSKRIGTTMVSGELTSEQRSDLEIKVVAARKVSIRVVDRLGQAISNATTGVIAGHRDAGAAQTDARGDSILSIPNDSDIQFIYAMKAGLGLDYRSFVLARNNRSDRNAVRPRYPEEGVTLTLDGVQPLELTMQTRDGQPIVGVEAYVWLLQKPGETDQLNLSMLGRRKLFVGTTDKIGQVAFNWVPQWQKEKLTLWPRTQAFAQAHGSYDPATGAGKVTLELDRLVSIRGKVLLPDGNPASGISVDIAGAGYTHDDFRRQIKTRENGEFELKAAPNQIYLLVVKDRKWAAQPLTGFALKPDQPVENLNFQLIPATRIHGRVTIGPDHKPVAGQQISSYQHGQDAHNTRGVVLPNPEKSNRWVCPMIVHNATTDAEGNYELFVGPGKFDIRGPSQNKIENYEITDQSEKTFDFQMSRPEKGILKGLVVDNATQQPIAGAKILGIERWHFGDHLQAIADSNGRFEVERNLHLTALHVSSPDKSLATILEADADTNEITISLRPTSSMVGILMDEETNSPAADKEFSYGVKVHMGDDKAPFSTAWGGKFTTDSKGHFHVDRLVTSADYKVDQTLIEGRSWRQVATVNLEKAGETDLGTITIKKAEEYRAPTTAERIQSAFKSDKSPIERSDATLPDAKLSRLRVLVLFANPESNATKQFLTLRYEDADVGSAFDDFRLIAVNSSAGYFDEAKLLAEKFDLDLREGRSVFFAVVTDAEGKLIDTAEAGELMRGGVINQEKVLAFLAKNKLPPLVAKDMYDAALAKAKQENKRIILQETATWCGPCWRLSRFLDKHRAEWETDYLWLKMDHRWTGSQELMKSIRGEAQGGIPWVAVLNADGKVLVTSNTPTGENIGFPSEPDEINHFQAMLKRTGQRMTAEQVDKLVDQLRPKN